MPKLKMEEANQGQMTQSLIKILQNQCTEIARIADKEARMRSKAEAEH